MATDGLLADSTAARATPLAVLAARGAFVVLLAAAPLLPLMAGSFFTYPEVSNWWVCLPFCGLFLLALGDIRRPLRLYNLDLLVLGSLIFALGCYDSSRTLPLQLVYPPLAYLAARMLWLARVGRAEGAPATVRRVFHPWLSWRWLLVGVVVMSAVHVHWALSDPSTSDVGKAGVWGASRIVHGEALYGADKVLTAEPGGDPHFDTYGPFNYEAYVPFVLVASASSAARLMTLFFCLLTAALLFVLGRRLRGPPVGLALAFAWLVYPFTLYSDGFDFNDALVAATLIGVLLAVGAPARRGAMTALAAWTKLSPLALVPLLLAHGTAARGRRWRAAAIFCTGFVLTSALLFVPAVDHSSVGTFLSRSFGYQSKRAPGYSIWALYDDSFRYSRLVVSASKIVHGLLLALTVGLAIVLPRLPRRQDLVGLAAASAAVLIALEIGDGYFSFSYLLWFVPLVLVALTCDREAAVGARAGTNAAAAALPIAVRPRPPWGNRDLAGISSMELGGLEPPTSWVRSRRSPN
jgi:hypothetical protein